MKEPGQNIVLIIDPQNDFHDDPVGSLAVPGSKKDAERTAGFIRDNMGSIGEIFITLDSHHKRHIAHAAFWSKLKNDVEGKGEQPQPFTTITHDDVKKGVWYPRDCSLQEHCTHYTEALENSENQFKLTIWPDHCLIGSGGHAIQPEIQKAVRDWDVANYKKHVKHIHKGMNCLTEMYSAIKAEVEISTDPATTKNIELLGELRKAGKLFVAGQALSHCVNFTVRDIVKDWKDNPRSTDLSNIVILTDCMSPVAGFEEHGKKFLADMAAAGCTVTTSTKAPIH